MTTYLIETPDRAVGSCVTILKLIILLFIIFNKINYNHLSGTTCELAWLQAHRQDEALCR